MHRLSFGIIAGLLATSGCEAGVSDPTPIIEPSYETVFSFQARGVPWEITSATDGSLFLASDAGLFRAKKDDYSAWERLTDQSFPAQDLYAPDGNTLFGVAGTGSVYRWTDRSGWERMDTPVSDSLVVDYDWTYGIRLNGLWGTSPTDVYAVGWGATVLHFDGVRWEALANPLHAVVDSMGPAAYAARLQGLAGDERGIWAVGADVLRLRDGEWSIVARPDTGRVAEFCGFNAAVSLDGALYAAGGELPCMVRMTPEGKWEDATTLVRGFSRPGIFNGAEQPDGSAMFWASSYGRGDVFYFGASSARILQFPDLQWFGGAAVADGSVFAAGVVGDSLVVVKASLGAPQQALAADADYFRGARFAPRHLGSAGEAQARQEIRRLK